MRTVFILLAVVVAATSFSLQKADFSSDDQLLDRIARKADKSSSEESKEDINLERKSDKRASSDTDDKKVEKKNKPREEGKDEKSKGEKTEEKINEVDVEGSGEAKERIKRAAELLNENAAADSAVEGSGEKVSSPVVRLTRDVSHVEEASGEEAPRTRFVREVEGSGADE